MSIVTRRWAEQYWLWEEIQDYAKSQDMEWSKEECQDFLDDHEDEMYEKMREVGNELVEDWLYEIKSDLDDAVAEEEEEEEERC